MKLNKGAKLAAAFLAAVIISTDFYGTYDFAYADEKETQPAAFDFSQAETAFAKLLADYDLYGVLAHDFELSVYESASPDSTCVHTLNSGYQVKLTGVELNETGLWYRIHFAVNDTEYSGYIPSEYFVTADSRLSEWRSAYLQDNDLQPYSPNNVRGADQSSAFPASYQALIQSLVRAHPNWKFVPMNTGLNWADVLKAEMEDSRNLVDLNSPDTWKSTDPKDYDAKTGKWIIKNGTNWVQASEAVVKYYLDPRNFLTEESVFQFEQLVYDKHHCTCKCNTSVILAFC